MKKGKIAILAILGFLSISGVAIGVAAANNFNNLNQYDASVPCNLTWYGGQNIILNNGSGTFVNSHVETSYTEAYLETGYHVVLGIGGTMSTSKKAWDGNISGFVNGLTSITVNFSTTAGGDFTTQEPDASLVLSAGFNETGDVLSQYYIKSGEEVTFSPSFAPKTFQLMYKLDANTYKPSVAKIQSVTVKCTMNQVYGVKLVETDKEVNYSTLKFSKGINEDEKLYYDWLKKTQFAYDDVMAIRSPDDAVNYLTKDDILVTNGEVTSKKLDKNRYETIFITCNGDMEINIKSHHQAALYTGKDFVGTYTIFDISNKTPTTAVVDEFGHLKVNSHVYDYSLDENGKMTFADYNNWFTKNGNYVRVKANGKYYVGAKGTNVKLELLKASAVNEYADIIAKLAIDDGAGQLIYVYRNNIIIDGLNSISIREEKLGVLNKDVIAISSNTSDGQENLFRNSSFNRGDGMINGDVITVYFEITGNVISLVEPLETAGTYTSNGKPDLIIDILGNVKIDTLTGENAYNIENNEVKIGDKLFIVDPNNKTYSQISIYNGEQWKTATTYAMYKGDSLTFNNGTVTIDTKRYGYLSKTAKYTVSENVVKFQFRFEADWDSSATEIPAKFELKINNDKTRLTVLLAKAIDSSEYLSKELYTKGTEFNIPKEIVDPWLTSPTSYQNGNQTITLNNGTITISFKGRLSSNTSKYYYDGEKIICEFKYSKGYDTVTVIAKLAVSLDLSSLTALNTVYDSSSFGANTIFGEGTVYNKVLA